MRAVLVAALAALAACDPRAEVGDYLDAPRPGAVPLCSVSSADICNGRDDDCDGAIDEGDVCSNPCGAAQVSRDCAVRNDGTLWCWGRRFQRPATDPLNFPYEAGHASIAAPQIPEAPGPITELGRDVLQVASQPELTCARKADGSLWCWGWLPPDHDWEPPEAAFMARPTRVRSLGFDVADVSLGRGGCAAKRDGSVWCWGENWSGEVGDATRAPRWVPVRVPGLGGPAVRVLAADLFRAALLVDGTVRHWGQLGETALFLPFRGGGQAHVTSERALVVEGISGAVDLDLAVDHGCARTAGGAVACWGANPAGQLGDGTTTGRLGAATAARSLPPAVEVAVDFGETCVRAADGLVRCVGAPGLATLTPPGASPWAEDTRGVRPPVALPERLARLSFPCSIATDGAVLCRHMRTGGSPPGLQIGIERIDLCARDRQQ